ncbi:hypothetical protein POM88_047287 [Heracleum sosnowskyi]|uniref:Uncharacterized protein n=1 Tax=Heracleum sosnowskyi TaxID=360622 RepID=A0AAD8LYK4_9APIA|nr:hypothetical protein POM88_047287 [Heracleum sosnowskyi]
MRQAEGMGRPVHRGKRIRSYSRLLCSINAQWKGMLVGLGEVVGPNKEDPETSVPEAKKEEQEQEVVLSRPSSSATTTAVVANVDPPFRKVTGPAVRSKVVCHCYGADRFTTSAPLSDIAG